MTFEDVDKIMVKMHEEEMAMGHALTPDWDRATDYYGNK